MVHEERESQTLGRGRELGVMDLVAILLRRRWALASTVLLGGLVAGVLAFVAPKKYQVAVLMVPVSSPGQGGLGSLGAMAGQLSGLSSLVGVSLSAGANERTEAIAVLQSAELTRKYIQERQLLPVLYSSSWDDRKGAWRPDAKPPTLWLANEYFSKKIRRVNEDTRTGLISLSITWTDPAVAAKWANDLVRVANEELRDRAILESQRAISFLREQAEKTTVLELKTAIYSVMKSEIEKEMLAKGREDYALKVVDPAVTPERHSSPSLVLWILGGVGGGFLIGSGAIMFAERKRIFGLQMS